MPALALAPGLRLGPQLRRASESGVAFVPDALVEPFRRRLLDELGSLAYDSDPETPLPLSLRMAPAAPLSTRSALAVVPAPPTGHPALATLFDDIVDRVHGDGCPGWAPNEIFVRRYRPGSTGMRPHTDGQRFRYLVATFTVAGSATFVHYDASGRVVAEWDTVPGSLVLLRAPGLAGVEGRGPRHAVGGPVGGPRCSVAFRMNCSG